MSDIDFQKLTAHLWRGGDYYSYWWWISEQQTTRTSRDGKEYTAPAEKETGWFPTSNPRPLPSAKGKHGLRHIYFGVHPSRVLPEEHPREDGTKRNQKYSRATLSMIAAINGVFAEFDEPTQIGDLPLAPSVIIESSPGKHHCYWLLREPFILDTEEAMHRAMRIQAAWVRLVESDHGAKDLSRVLRVPGTRNVKEKYGPDYPLVAFKHCDLDCLYGIEEFESLVQHLMPAPTTPYASKPEETDGSKVEAALQAISVATWDDYDDWVNIGMALYRYDSSGGLALWVRYSRKSSKYREGLCERKWITFSKKGMITVATLFHYANMDTPGWLDDWREQNRPAPIYDSDGRACCPTCGEHLRESNYGGAWCPNCNKDGSHHWKNETAVKSRPDASNGNGHHPEEPMPHRDALARTTDGGSEALIWQCFEAQEAGDAQLFAEIHKGTYVFDTSMKTKKGWFRFVGPHWEHCSIPPYSTIHQDVAALYLNLAASEQKRGTDQKSIDALITRAKALRSQRRIESVLTLASEMMQVPGDIWDRDPWLLAVKNGVLYLRTGDLREGRPEDYLRSCAPIAWDGLDTPSPGWEKFISDILDQREDIVAYLQVLLGYALVGVATEKVLPILWGEYGFNGRTTMFETIGSVLGSYASAVPKEAVVGGKDSNSGAASPHLMMLQGKRLTWCSEISRGNYLNNGFVKRITGDDCITARKLHQDYVSWKPTHTIFLLVNDAPKAYHDDESLWQRLKYIPFTLSFVSNPRHPHERKADQRLKEKLQKEAPGILAWLVRGCLRWQDRGLQPFEPESVTTATRAEREKNDQIGQFLSEECVLHQDAFVESTRLYTAFVDWCAGSRPVSQTKFGTEIKKRPGIEKKFIYAVQKHCYTGVGLAAERDADDQGRSGFDQGCANPDRNPDRSDLSDCNGKDAPVSLHDDQGDQGRTRIFPHVEPHVEKHGTTLIDPDRRDQVGTGSPLQNAPDRDDQGSGNPDRTLIEPEDFDPEFLSMLEGDNE